MNLLILEHNNFSLYVSNHVCQMVAEVLSALQWIHTCNWRSKGQRHWLDSKQQTNTMGHLIPSHNVTCQNRSQQHITSLKKTKHWSINSKPNVVGHDGTQGVADPDHKEWELVQIESIDLGMICYSPKEQAANGWCHRHNANEVGSREDVNSLFCGKAHLWNNHTTVSNK